MFDRLRNLWLPRLCFAFSVALAVGISLGVGVAPWLDSADPHPQGTQRWIAVFAREPLVRRTALVCAIGLVVTAWVFFRPIPPSGNAKLKRPQPPAPLHIPGA